MLLIDTETTSVKALKSKIAAQEKELAELRAKIDSADTLQQLAVREKELEVKLQMKDAVEKAYDNGFKRCQESFKELKALLNVV